MSQDSDASAVPTGPAPSGLSPCGSQAEPLVPSVVRPNRNDPAIVAAAARKIAEVCVEWDGEDSAVEDWIDDLIKCCFDWDDGYRLAKALDDRCYVHVDADLVEALGAASYAHSDAHEAAVREWVKANQIKPDLEVGDRVSCRFGEGVIGGAHLDRAIYLFVPDGEREKYARGGGIHLNFEDAVSLGERA